MMDLLVSGIGGGLTGLLGTALTSGLNIIKGRQQHKNEVELRLLDNEQAKTEAAFAMQLQAQEAESEAAQASWDALAESHRDHNVRLSDGSSGWLALVDVVRGLTRPLLTLALVLMTFTLYLINDDPALRSEITSATLYLTGVCVTWWFAERYSKKGGGVRNA